MEVQETAIRDVKILTPKVFRDERGFFLESYREDQFQNLLGLSAKFVQDNHSSSTKNVLRGLHYQLEQPQGKLVRVTRGEVFDVAVDLRRNSPTFGKWVGIYLSESNHRMAWIPSGFAHGFLSLSERADVLYKVTSFYHPASDRSLLFCDKSIAIHWPSINGEPLLSEKDKRAKTLEEADCFP